MTSYIIQSGIKGDYWGANGKINLETASQKELEYLHSIGYDGVIKVDSLDKPAKKK